MNFESLLATIGTNLVWQAILVSLVVFVVLNVLPRSEAKIRYSISLTGLLGMFLLACSPLMPNLLPALIPEAAPSTAPSLFEPNVIIGASGSSQQSVSTSPFAAPLQSFSWAGILVAIWAFGTMLAFLSLVRVW